MKTYYCLLSILIFALTCCKSNSQEDPGPNPGSNPDSNLTVTGNYVFLNSIGIYSGKPVANKIETTLLYNTTSPGSYPTIFAAAKDLTIDRQENYIYWSSGYAINRAPLKEDGVIDVVYDFEQEDLTFFFLSTFTIDATNNELYVLESGLGLRKIFSGDMDGSSSLLNIYTSDPPTQIPFYDPVVSDIQYFDKKLYWIENSADIVRIVVFDISSKTLATLFDSNNGLYSGTHLAIDGTRNKIYIADKKSSSSTGIIYSGNLDGSGSLTTIYDGTPAVHMPRDLRIDTESGHLFWVNTQKHGLPLFLRADIDNTRLDTLKIEGNVGTPLNFLVLPE